MSENYSPDDSFPTFPIVLPIDGELVNHAILVDGIIKPLVNAAGYLRNMPGTAHYKLSSRSVTRVQQSPIVKASNGDAAFAGFVTAASGENYDQAVLVPHGAVVTELRVALDPATHGSIAGLTLPLIQLWKQHAATGVQTKIGEQSDTSANAGAYSVLHEIAITGLSETVDRSAYYYFARFQAETGTGADTVTLFAFRITATVTQIDDAY